MNIFELLIFALLSAALLALGQLLSKRWGTAGWLVGIVPVAFGWIWVLLGAVRGLITDFKYSVMSRPVCRQGKCRSRDYVLVSSTAEEALFRCRCGDLYLSKANLFVRVLPNNSKEPYMARDSSGKWSRSDVSTN